MGEGGRALSWAEAPFRVRFPKGPAGNPDPIAIPPRTAWGPGASAVSSIQRGPRGPTPPRMGVRVQPASAGMCSAAPAYTAGAQKVGSFPAPGSMFVQRRVMSSQGCLRRASWRRRHQDRVWKDG